MPTGWDTYVVRSRNVRMTTLGRGRRRKCSRGPEPGRAGKLDGSYGCPSSTPLQGCVPERHEHENGRRRLQVKDKWGRGGGVGGSHAEQTQTQSPVQGPPRKPVKSPPSCSLPRCVSVIARGRFVSATLSSFLIGQRYSPGHTTYDWAFVPWRNRL